MLAGAGSPDLGAFSSISRSDGVEDMVSFGSVNVLPRTAVPAAPPWGGTLLPMTLPSGTPALKTWPFFSGYIMKDVEQRMQTIIPWRTFSLELGSF